MSRTRVTILAIPALLWLCNGLLQAGSGNPPPQHAAASHQNTGEPPPPVLKVATRMVLVDVVVTDKNGSPVAGLKPADFEVLEDGQKQQIRAFGASGTPSGQPVARRTLPPNVFTNTVEFRSEEGPPVIILMDALNTPWADQVYGRNQLLTYLSEHQAQRNIAIYGLGHRLQLLQEFTADSALLRQAVLGNDLKPSYSDKHLQPAAPNQSSAGGIARLDSAPTDPVAHTMAQLKRQLFEMENAVTTFDRDIAIRTTLEALSSIARHAAAVPGRKQLLWLSAGFPLNLAIVRDTPYYDQMVETANLLADAQVAVYPVDVRGLVAFFPTEMPAGMAQLTATHMGMKELASRTGGLPFYDHNDITKVLERAVDDGATYYVLGYYPTNKKWNGDFRSIQVKLQHSSGLKARFRKGYFAVDASSASKAQMKAARSEFLKALAPDALTAGMLPIFVEVVPPAKEHSQLFLDVRVDPRSVTFEAGPDNLQQAELEYVTVVLDAKRKLVTSKRDTLKANLTPDTFAKVIASSLAIRQKFDLPPGKYFLKFGVRDLKSNLIGTVTAEADVPAQN